MIIVVESRQDVGDAYVSAFRREGVAAAVMHVEEIVEWLGALSGPDVTAVNAVILGEGAQTVEVARAVRGQSRCPMIALADRRVLSETLVLFSLGVDDVVCKPVHVRELIARVRVIAERVASSPAHSRGGDITLFLDGRDPEVAGQSVSLPRRERRILECLIDARGAWLTKSQIFNQVYGLFNEDVDECVIESHISRLRRRLRERLGRDAIDSQRYLGYRFLAKARSDASHISARSEQGSHEVLAAMEFAARGASNECLRDHADQYVGHGGSG